MSHEITAAIAYVYVARATAQWDSRGHQSKALDDGCAVAATAAATTLQIQFAVFPKRLSNAARDHDLGTRILETINL